MPKSNNERNLYIKACLDKAGNVWVKTNAQWKTQFRVRLIGKDYLYIDTYTSNIETTPEKPADSSDEIENGGVYLRDGNFIYYNNARLDNVTCE